MMKKRSLIYIALVACATLAISCLKDNDVEPTPLGGLTMVNAFIESSPQGVLYAIDRSAVPPEYSPLAYRSYGFVNLFLGNNRMLEVYTAADQIKLVDTAFAVDSTYYSSFVYGTLDQPLHFITEDRVPEDVADPDAIAGARFFNLANTSHRVTLRVGDTDPIPSFEDRPRETPQSGKAAEDFLTVPTGTYELVITDEDGETLVTRGDVALEAGSYSSIFLTGDDTVEDSYYIGVIQVFD